MEKPIIFQWFQGGTEVHLEMNPKVIEDEPIRPHSPKECLLTLNLEPQDFHNTFNDAMKNVTDPSI